MKHGISLSFVTLHNNVITVIVLPACRLAVRVWLTHRFCYVCQYVCVV